MSADVTLVVRRLDGTARVVVAAAVVLEVERLLAAYLRAQQLADLAEDDFLDAEAERLWDSLVDFVEANELNFTDHDPRGPEVAS